MDAPKTSDPDPAGVLPPGFSAEALLCAAFLLLAACLRPWTADVPINDDWSYLIPAFRLAQDGVLRLTGDSPATHVFHVAAGALGIRLFGWGIGGLKLLTLAWHFAGSLLLLRLLRLMGTNERAALLGALTYAFNPLLLVLCAAFMTDIPYLALSIAALYGYALALKDADAGSSRLRLLWIASSAAAGAYLVKQLGLFLPAAATFALWRAGRADRKRLAAAWTPVILAFAGHQLWYHVIHGPTWQGTADGVYLRALRFFLSPSDLLLDGPLHASGMALHLALFLSPLAAGLASKPAFPPFPTKGQAVFLAAAALAIGAAGAFPYLENSFYRTGIGTATIAGTIEKASGVLGWRWFWPVVSGLCVLSGFVSVERIEEALKNRDIARDLLLATAVLQLGASLATTKYLDRYPLYGLPPLIALLLLPKAGPPPRLRAALAVFFAFAAVGLPAARDYAAWNKAKWELAATAVADGLRPVEVEAGHDWDLYWTYEKEMARLAREKPLREIEEWEWLGRARRRAFVSFAPPGSYSHHGEKLLRKTPYETPLSFETEFLYLYEKKLK